MNLTRTKQRIVTLGAAALLSLSLAVPALADPIESEQNVVVTGSVMTTLSFEIDNPSVDFGEVDPLGTDNDQSYNAVDADGVSDGACYVSDTAVHFAIKSNLPYNGYVLGQVIPGSHTAGLGLDKLSRSEPAFARDLPYFHCVLSWDFAGGFPLWAFGGPTALAERTNEYALQVDWSDRPGVVAISLTYSIGQL